MNTRLIKRLEAPLLLALVVVLLVGAVAIRRDDTSCGACCSPTNDWMASARGSAC